MKNGARVMAPKACEVAGAAFRGDDDDDDDDDDGDDDASFWNGDSRGDMFWSCGAV